MKTIRFDLIFLKHIKYILRETDVHVKSPKYRRWQKKSERKWNGYGYHNKNM